MTIETEESIVIRAGAGLSPSALWCPACGRHVDMVTLEQAAHIGGVSPRTVFDWMETGLVHFIEAGEGLSICRPSLPSKRAASRPALSTGKTSLHRRKP